jgi:hypothetical protein
MNQYTSQIRLVCDHLQAALVPLHQLEESRESVPFYSAQARKVLESVEGFLARMGPDSLGTGSEATGTQSEGH